MAMSFTRPDPGSPAQIADATFSTARRGFDHAEVRDFLQMVAAEMSRLTERVRFLEREIDATQTSPEISARLDEETLTRLLGEETARVLSAARSSASEIREKAELAAAQLVGEANDEANRLREEVELEISRRRADAAADSEAELEMAKQQGREMVNEARAYRERVLSELSRRRELAREQIEQLVHGRDRLLAAFEQARLAAVDVMSGLEPLGEPDEYVNLSPTTGPVPVMIARDRPSARVEEADVAADREPATSDSSDDDSVGVAEAADDREPLDGEAPDAAEVDDEPEIGDPVTEDAPVTDPGNQADPVIEVDAVIEADTTTEVEAATDDAVAAAPADTGSHEAASTDDTESHDVASTDDEVDADDSADGAAPDQRDDVVVDLFARLRTAAAQHVPEDVDDAPGTDVAVEADVDAVAEAELDTPVETDTEVVVETEPDTAVETDTELAVGVEPVVAAEIEVDDTEGVAEAGDAIDPADAPFDRRDAELTPLIVAAARKLKRVLADEQNDVLDAIRTSPAITSLGQLVPVQPEQAGRYADAIGDDLLVAAQAGASSTDDHGVVTLARRDARSSVDAAVDQLVEHLIAPLRTRLDRAVLDADGDSAALTKKVRAVYREVKTRHIDDVLDDVLLAAYGAGLFAALDGDVRTRWLVDRRHPCGPDCEDNTLAPPTLRGEPFPTGHLAPPMHPGCRCLLQIAPR